MILIHYLGGLFTKPASNLIVDDFGNQWEMEDIFLWPEGSDPPFEVYVSTMCAAWRYEHDGTDEGEAMHPIYGEMWQ